MKLSRRKIFQFYEQENFDFINFITLCGVAGLNFILDFHIFQRSNLTKDLLVI